MRHFLTTITVATLATILGGGWALAQSGHGQPKRPRQPLGNNPHPVIWGGQNARKSPKTKSARPAPRPPQRNVAHHTPARHYHHHNVYRSYNNRFGSPYPYRSAAYGYTPYYGNRYVHRYGDSYGYRCYPDSYLYPSPHYLYPPPLYLPAGLLFGPQATQQFFGWNNGARPRPNINAAEPPKPEIAVQRATNARSNALAWRFIGFGDAQFAQQKYAEANDRYRKASRSAPQLADAWFRQGFAMIATGRYDLAVKSIWRGLRLDPKWSQANFDLDQLYNSDVMAKNAHLESLAQAADDKPNDPDRLFLLGVFLHFDGQPDRASPLFERAQDVAGGDAGHIEAFLR